MNNLRTLTIKDIRALKPCYDPSIYLPEGWTGTVLDILDIEDCPEVDRLWVVLELVDRFTVEVFAIDCAVVSHKYADAAAAIAVDDAYAAAYAAAAYAGGKKRERQLQMEALYYLLGGYDE